MNWEDIVALVLVGIGLVFIIFCMIMLRRAMK